MSASVRGVVLSGTGGVWRVHTELGEIVDAALRGRLKHVRGAEAAPLKLAVGDDVCIEQAPGIAGAWAIAEILPRRSKLARRTPGRAGGERVLAANVDQVIVVFAAAKPEPHTRMLDRFLVIAEANGLAATVVVNKSELVDPAQIRARFGVYEDVGYSLLATSVKAERSLGDLRAVIAGRRSVFTGPSGVGKSSLLNALFPGSNLRVGAISESVNKGRHTTVGAVMLPLPDDGGTSGGYVVDTPGLREVGLWDLPAEHLDTCFPEIRAARDDCRFADCVHGAEPGCAVRAAVGDGTITEDRYMSYRHLYDELQQSSG